MEESANPSISVLVAVTAAPDALPDVLSALEHQDGFGSAEVILVDGTESNLGDLLQAEFPWLRIIRFPGGTLPELKRAAIQSAAAEILAILDPFDVPAPGWLRAARDAMDPDGPAGVGGVVLPGGDDTASNRAAYLFEYGAFNPPVVEGRTQGDLPGNNVVYRRRQLLEECADLLAAEGFNKPFFHERIRATGGTLAICPEMRVHHRTRYRLLPFAIRRLHYGRCFGATRWRRSSWGMRAAYWVAAPMVPMLLMARHLARSIGHDQNRALAATSWPALLAICLFWGLGEWWGVWFGAGRSCGKFT